MIDLTPVEVRKKKNDFRRAMRGYDAAQVDDFIDLVADRLEQLVREHATLSERVGRQEQQIAEYRERERALTEALVSAQEYREEMRKQATREAEQAKSSAHEESSQVRAAAQHDVLQLRSTAEQEAAALRADAERYVAELRAAAEREAAEIRGNAAQERKREEQVLDNLRAHQETLLSTYREFLERELQEITSAAGTFGVDASAPPAAPQAPAPPPRAAAAPAAPAAPAQAAPPAPPAPATPPPARAAAAVIAGSAITLAPESGTEEPGPSLEPAVPSRDEGMLPYSPSTLTNSGGGMAPLDMSALGTTSFEPPPPAPPPPAQPAFNAPAFGLRSSFDPPAQQRAPLAAADVLGEPPSFEASYPNAAPVAPDEEPFAPEPFEPEAFDPDDVGAEDDPQELPLLSYDEPEAEPVNATALYDTIATPEPDGVPGPIGLAPSELAWGEDLNDDSGDEEEEDEETARLLRNAAAAGYHLPDDDELLLEEAVEEETEKGKGSSWLPNLLEDDS